MELVRGVVPSGRVDRSRRTAALVAGDVLLIAGLLAWGSTFHDIHFVEYPWHVTQTILPFVIGWLLAAPLAGAYSREARSGPVVAAVYGFGTWVPASLIGLLLRDTPYLVGSAPLSFALVIVGLGGITVAGWRLLFATVS